LITIEVCGAPVVTVGRSVVTGGLRVAVNVGSENVWVGGTVFAGGNIVTSMVAVLTAVAAAAVVMAGVLVVAGVTGGTDVVVKKTVLVCVAVVTVVTVAGAAQAVRIKIRQAVRDSHKQILFMIVTSHWRNKNGMTLLHPA
jgi:hypothetical protein